HLPEPPAGPELESVWQRAIPPAATPYTVAEAQAYARWLRITRSLARRSSDPAGWLGFPAAYDAEPDALASLHPVPPPLADSGTLRAVIGECLQLVAQLAPSRRHTASQLAVLLRVHDGPPDMEVESAIERMPWPAADLQHSRASAIVYRILADLG